MPKLISLRPIQTGDACYLQDHHNRDGECIITVTMHDGCSTVAAAQAAIWDAANAADVGGAGYLHLDTGAVAEWCAAQWQLVQACRPAATDRDTDGQDEDRYLECHILASWEV